MLVIIFLIKIMLFVLFLIGENYGDMEIIRKCVLEFFLDRIKYFFFNEV